MKDVPLKFQLSVFFGATSRLQPGLCLLVQVQILARTSAILTDYIRGFSQSRKVNVWPRPLSSKFFPIHYSSFIISFSAMQSGYWKHHKGAHKRYSRWLLTWVDETYARLTPSKSRTTEITDWQPSISVIGRSKTLHAFQWSSRAATRHFNG
jgi:hypothetical protein